LPLALSKETFTQVVENGAVVDLILAITSRIIRRGESVGDLVLSVEAGYLLAEKVHSVVGDDGMGEPEAAHYILPEELDNLLLGDFREAMFGSI